MSYYAFMVFQLTPADGFVQRRSKKEPWQPKESLVQAAVVDWSKWARNKYPDLDLLFCVPNGVPLHGPQRFAVIAWLKAQGLKPGVPDLCLPTARGGYWGMYLEQKIHGGKLSPLQVIWINNLRRAGYYVAVCDSYEQAIAELEHYCRLPPTAKSA